jgi:ATP-dependent Clp protease adapter protein ClpS
MRVAILGLCALALLGQGEGMRVGAPARATSSVRAASVIRSSSRMSDQQQEQQKRRSRLATVDRVKPDLEVERKEQVDKEPIWRVLLHNDDVHTFDYVSMSIVKVVKTVSRKKAFKITVEAHMSGIATVTTTWKAQAKSYCMGLQKMGLTSSIAPDPSMTS